MGSARTASNCSPVGIGAVEPPTAALLFAGSCYISSDSLLSLQIIILWIQGRSPGSPRSPHTISILLVLQQFPDLFFQRSTKSRPARVCSISRPCIRVPGEMASKWARNSSIRRNLEMAKAFVHSWGPAKEDGDVLVCGVNPSKRRLAQFH